MRYYVVDINGNVWGDYSSFANAKNRIDIEDESTIKEYELEIIEGV